MLLTRSWLFHDPVHILYDEPNHVMWNFPPDPTKLTLKSLILPPLFPPILSCSLWSSCQAFRWSFCFHLRPSSCFGLSHILCHLMFNALPPTMRPHHSLEALSPNNPHSWKESCISFLFPWSDCCCFIIISLLLYLTYNRCKIKFWWTLESWCIFVFLI